MLDYISRRTFILEEKNRTQVAAKVGVKIIVTQFFYERNSPHG